MKNFAGGIGENLQAYLLRNRYIPSIVAGMRVARSRFLPVKTTSDLLLVMSDLYNVKHGSLTMSPKRGFLTVPLVKLGDMNFRKVCVDTIPQLYRLAYSR